jgi:hypothetical protein
MYKKKDKTHFNLKRKLNVENFHKCEIGFIIEFNLSISLWCFSLKSFFLLSLPLLNIFFNAFILLNKYDLLLLSLY